MSAPLTRLGRLLLWDFERGSLAYDLLVLFMALVLFLLPEAVVRDPLRLPR